MAGNEKTPPTLKEVVEEIVESAGGWLNVIERVAPSLSNAIAHLGHNVDCPFPDRHSNGGGKDKFRFFNKADQEGRAICSCKHDGWDPFSLLIEAGVGSDFTKVCLEIKRAYARAGGYKAKAQAAVTRPHPGLRRTSTPEENARKVLAMKGIVKDVLPLTHPEAGIGRLYFQNRGIPVTEALQNVWFHPALPYNRTKVVEGRTVKEVVGHFPAIVSVFRNGKGRPMNLHRIYLTQDGHKLVHSMVTKPKKVCAGLDNWSKTSIPVATIPESRTVHLCEGVEKAWALHLVTGESVKAANACTSLPGQFINRADYDDVVLWADHDPYNDKCNKAGDGQAYMYKLFVELMRQGFRVCLMIPDTNPTKEAKGPDWEDIVVSEKVLDLPLEQRFDYLRTRALEGGVFTPTGHAKKRSAEPFDASKKAA